jgi:hypothetical protein
MGEPLNLRKVIKVNLPDLPEKTFDDIVWASNATGTAFAATRIVIEDDLFIPVTFLDSVSVFAIIPGDGAEIVDYVEEFTVTVNFPLNPFIGTWEGSDGRTWSFETNGTYGKDDRQNVGSFVVWSGKPGRKFLIILDGTDDEMLTVEKAAAGLYKTYRFEESGNTIRIIPITFNYAATNKQDPSPFDEDIYGTPVTLTRLDGEPAALDLSQNATAAVMLGGWSGGFSGTAFDPTTGTINIGTSPSISYAPDSRILYGSYDGVWLKRGKVFIAVGNDGRRWDPPAMASWETVTAAAMDNKEVVLISEYRPGGSGTPYSRGTNSSLLWRLTKFPTE